MDNWPYIVSRLARYYGTKKVLAQRLQISRTALGELCCGRTKEPRYSTGKKLIDLYQQLPEESR